MPAAERPQRHGNDRARAPARLREAHVSLDNDDPLNFRNLTREQRILKCRSMAADAERLASKSQDHCPHYLDLAAKWMQLAQEMQQSPETPRGRSDDHAPIS